jgi:hypothetical protein
LLKSGGFPTKYVENPVESRHSCGLIPLFLRPSTNMPKDCAAKGGPPNGGDDLTIDFENMAPSETPQLDAKTHHQFGCSRL